MILAPKPPAPPQPADGQAPLQQPIPEVIYAFGRTRIAGFFVIHEEQDGNLYQVMAVKDGIFDTVQKYYLNDDAVSLDSSGYVQPLAEGAYGGNTVRLMWHDGSPMPDGTPLASNPLKPVIDGLSVINSDFRPDGIAALGAIYAGVQAKDFSAIYPNGVPQPSVAGKTTRVYDWRDPDQVESDPSTWRFSDNCVLVRAWYECHCPHGPGTPFADLTRGILDIWTRQADICDEMVETYEGDYVKRYTCGYWWRAPTERSAIRAAIMSACDGWDFPLGNGALIFRVGRYHSPLVTLTDRDIVAFQFAAGALNGDYVNEIAIKYTDPDLDFGEVDAEPWRDDAGIVRHGRKATTLELWPVQTRSQARRIAKRQFDRNNALLRGTLTTNLRSIVAMGDRYVRVQSEMLAPLGDVVIEVMKQRTSLQSMTRTIEFIVINPNTLDAWEAEWDGPPPPEVEKVQSGPPPAPENVAGVATYDFNSGVPAARLAISWDETDRGDLRWTVFYRRTGEDVSEEMLVTEPLIEAGRVYATTGIVFTDTTYVVTVSASGVGGASEASTPVNVSTTTEAVAPGEPTDLAAVGGSGEAVITWRAPETLNFYAARVYRAADGDPFADAVLVATVPGSISAPMEYTDTSVGPGAWDYFVTSVNFHDTESTPAGPETANVST